MTESPDFSLEDRLLCSDGSCIGVIGNDGRCKVCGKTYTGDDEATPSPSEASDPKDLFSQNEEGTEGDESPFSPEDRIPCPDGTCVGIIGPDGTCGTCGMKSE